MGADDLGRGGQRLEDGQGGRDARRQVVQGDGRRRAAWREVGRSALVLSRARVAQSRTSLAGSPARGANSGRPWPAIADGRVQPGRERAQVRGDLGRVLEGHAARARGARR